MFAVIVSAGAGQVFAAEKDLPDPSKVGCWSCSWLSGFRSQARNVAQEVRDNAPAIEAVGTAVISASKIIAAANGDTKAVKTLDAAQIVLNGAADAVAADDIRTAIKIGEDTVLAIDPRAAKDIEKLNHVISQGEAVAAIAKPLIEIAVANAGKK